MFLFVNNISLPLLKIQLIILNKKKQKQNHKTPE